MKKGIFQKLIMMYVSVLLLGFIIVGTMMYVFLGNFVIEQKVNDLKASSENLAIILNFYADGFITMDRLVTAMAQESKRKNSMVWFVTKDGYLELYDIDELKRFGIWDKLEKQNGGLRLPDVKQYNKVMVGTDEIVVEKEDLHGLFKDTSFPWLTVEKPFLRNGEIIGAIYLNTPIPEVKKARSTVFQFFWVASIVSIIVSFILIYIFSRRLTRPLKEITEAARVIASGEFGSKLQIDSEDEIGELASSFNHMIVALENLEGMRRDFIANVSHELRTPMTSIRGFIEGILDGTIPTEKQPYYLNIVKDETTRLSRLVNDLLDLARMESGEVSLSMRNFNINELVRICIINLESIIIKKNIIIEADFEDEESFVNGDRDAIERVIINLIHNAVKFSSEGGKILISSQTRKEKIVIMVRDFGIGIDANEIDMIWDRFYKTDKSRGKDKTGTGLGLAIVKNIINEHKQEIWVESTIGKGTAFYFTLDKAE